MERRKIPAFLWFGGSLAIATTALGLFAIISQHSLSPGKVTVAVKAHVQIRPAGSDGAQVTAIADHESKLTR